MKAMPTLEGGLRIDTENFNDWGILRSIVVDANDATTHDLASRMGALLSEEAGGEDWQEYIVPDLRESFHDELAQVGAAIESAIHIADSGPGPIWINRDEVFPWYSALNQARLALEERYHFGPAETISLEGNDPVRRTAFMRSKFYCAIQCLLLDYVMGPSKAPQQNP